MWLGFELCSPNFHHIKGRPMCTVGACGECARVLCACDFRAVRSMAFCTFGWCRSCHVSQCPPNVDLAPPPVIGPPRDDAPHGFACACCVFALRAHERAKITENWIFSKFSKFDWETNLTILVNFPSDVSCVCASFLGIYRPKGRDLANLIITLFLRDIWPIQIFLQSASSSDCQSFYTGAWGGRPIENQTYTGRGQNSVFSQVDYCD